MSMQDAADFESDSAENVVDRLAGRLHDHAGRTSLRLRLLTGALHTPSAVVAIRVTLQPANGAARTRRLQRSRSKRQKRKPRAWSRCRTSARSWTILLSILWRLFRATLFWLRLVGIGVGGHGGGHGYRGHGFSGGHRSGPHR